MPKFSPSHTGRVGFLSGVPRVFLRFWEVGAVGAHAAFFYVSCRVLSHAAAARVSYGFITWRIR